MPPESASLPSSTLHDLEVNLHGLSFSTHDTLPQRTAISSTLTSTLRYAASGLLVADHGAPELSKTLSQLSNLLLTPVLSSSILWSQVPATDADTIATMYYTEASSLLHTTDTIANFPPNLTDMVIRNVKAATALLQVAANAPTRKSAIVRGQPAAALLHVCLFLGSTSHTNAPQHALEQFRLMCRAETLSDCVIHSFPSFRHVLSRACTIEADAYRKAGLIIPAAVVREVCDSFASHERLEDGLDGLLEVVLPLVEDLDVESRRLAIEGLYSILNAASKREVKQRVSTLAPVLRGSMVWRDARTAEVLAPLIDLVYGLMKGEKGLGEEIDGEWERGVDSMIQVVESLGTLRREGDGTEGLKVAVAFAKVVATVMKERVLRKVGQWMPLVVAIMVSVAMEIGRGTMDADVFDQAADVVLDAIRWGWLLESVFRAKVFEGCMTAVLEVRRCASAVKKCVWDSAENILACLAACDRQQGVLGMVTLMREQTRKYGSLHEVDEFFSRIEGRLRSEAIVSQDSIEEKVISGRYAERFFGEVS
eukprot:GFKZ01012198.1.p1 GENE.GFKZ01012198.1~~GFKZ01012198.1.p1  ORF type:complete len:538 (+),score=62.56 GFKZ01012198.1:221-1834(+)